MTVALSGWQRVLLVVWLAACTACAGRLSKLTTEPIGDLDRAELLNFPESYRMVHRVRLSVRGRGMDFIGYLAVKGACLRAVALMEVGGEMFDLLACAGKTDVLKNPGRVPLTPLKRGIMRELAALFTPPLAGQVSPNPGKPGRRGLTIHVKGQAMAGGKRKTSRDDVHLLLLENGRLFSRVDIHSYRTVEGWPHPVPDEFTLKNELWGYELNVELIRLDLRPISEQVFSGK
jgi:hypothetical protein